MSINRIEDFVFAHHEKPIVQQLASLASPGLRLQLYLTGAFDNALEADKLVSGVMTLGQNRGCCGFADDWQRVESLNKEFHFKEILLLGNEAEQRAFLAHYRPGNLTVMPFSSNTKDQSEKAAQYCKENELLSIAYLCHETLAARAYLTLIKQLVETECHIPVVPLTYIGRDRLLVSPRLRRLGIDNEARKLRKFQLKHDVATVEEALHYIETLNDPVTSMPDTLCIIY